MKGLIITALILALGAFIISIVTSIIKIKKKEGSGITQLLTTLIMTFILFTLTINILGSVGNDKAEIDWCKENMGHLSNQYNARFWMGISGESCCTEGSYHSYERDEGTMTRFLFGKTARYRESNCEWIDGGNWGEPSYGTYEEPSKFKKVLLSFKYMEEDMLVQ